MPRTTLLRRSALSLVIALALGACGPELSLDVGVKQAPIDATFGKPGDDRPIAEAAAPVATTFPSLTPSTFTAPRRVAPGPAFDEFARDNGGTPVTEKRPPPDCPDPGPLAVPKEGISASVAGPPKPGRYRYLRTGELFAYDPDVQDYVKSLGTFEAEVTRDITNIRVGLDAGLAPDDFQYDVIDHTGEYKTTTTYAVESTGNAPGLKIRHQMIEHAVYMRPYQSTLVPPLRLMNLPAAREPKFSNNDKAVDVLTDPQFPVTAEIVHFTLDKVRVPLCGEVVDAWRGYFHGNIDRTGWLAQMYRYFEPWEAENSQLFVAPQYGALIVKDQLNVQFVDSFGAGSSRLKVVTTLKSLTPEPLP